MKQTEKDLVFAGYAGETGAVRIADVYSERIAERFRAGLLTAFHTEEGLSADRFPEETDVLGARLMKLCGAEEFRTTEEGGILKTLYLLSEEKKCGMRIRLKEIPVRQETIEVSELFRLNPYRLMSRGILLIGESGSRMAEKLKEQNIPAACIGTLNGGLDKAVVDKSETEYINRPEPDEVFKVLPDLRKGQNNA